MTYADQLKSPKWQRKRLLILERDEFTCKSCGSTENQLHVHHGAYLSGKKVWDYPDDMLHSLCEKCHKEVESFIFEMNEQLGTIPQKEEYFNLIKRIATNIWHLSAQSRDSIDNIIDLSLDSAHLNHLLSNKS